MATTKGDQQQPFYCSDPNPYQLPQQQQDQYYILLPYHPRRLRTRHLKRNVLCFFSLLLFLLALFFLWPSDPKLNIVRVQLNHVRPHLTPSVSLDISMAVTIKVRNSNFFSFKYNSLVVSIGYRGRQLGLVNSNQGFVRARASSYVNATFVLDGIQVIHDVIYLVEDLAKGSIPFDTITEVRGSLGLLFFDVPIEAKVSCEVYVDTSNQTIVRQDCYPE